MANTALRALSAVLNGEQGTMIVLLPSGMAGAVALGPLQALADTRAPMPDVMAGASSGLANSHHYVFGDIFSTSKILYQSAAAMEFMRLEFRMNSLPPWRWRFDVEKYLKAALGDCFEQRTPKHRTKMFAVATCVANGASMLLDYEENPTRALRASSAIRGLCSPVDIDGVLYEDGVHGCALPLRQLAARCNPRYVLIIGSQPVERLRQNAKAELQSLLEREDVSSTMIFPDREDPIVEFDSRDYRLMEAGRERMFDTTKSLIRMAQ